MQLRMGNRKDLVFLLTCGKTVIKLLYGLKWRDEQALDLMGRAYP